MYPAECDCSVRSRSSGASVTSLGALILPCRRCGRTPAVITNGYSWTVFCESCFEPHAPAATRYEFGSACVRIGAIQDWNARRIANQMPEAVKVVLLGNHVRLRSHETCVGTRCKGMHATLRRGANCFSCELTTPGRFSDIYKATNAHSVALAANHKAAERYGYYLRTGRWKCC